MNLVCSVSAVSLRSPIRIIRLMRVGLIFGSTPVVIVLLVGHENHLRWELLEELCSRLVIPWS